MAEPGGTITVNAKSWVSLVPERGARFVPLVDLTTAKKSVFNHWQRINTLLPELPDPADYPPIPGQIPAADQALLRRFIDAAEELPQSSLVSDDLRFDVSLRQNSLSTVLTAPGREALRGSVVLLRQLHHHGEEASYAKVKKTLDRLTLQAEDPDRAVQRRMLREWQGLRALTTSGLIERRMEALGMKIGGVPPKIADLEKTGSEPMFSFDELTTLFLYGDLVHWGAGRDKHAALIRDDYVFKRALFDFLLIGRELACFYMGYSVLVRAALSSPRRA